MTNETMTWVGWLDKVLDESGVSFKDFEPFREMVQRWFQVGEPYSIAALTLKISVKERLNAIRIQEQSEKDIPKRLLAHAIKGGLK